MAKCLRASSLVIQASEAYDDVAASSIEITITATRMGRSNAKLTKNATSAENPCNYFGYLEDQKWQNVANRKFGRKVLGIGAQLPPKGRLRTA